MEKESLELEKLRLEIDDIRRKRFVYLLVDKLLIAGIIALVGIFGNIWIEKIRSSAQHSIEDLKRIHAEQLAGIENSYKTKSDLDRRNFEERLQLFQTASNLMRQDIEQRFQTNLATFREVMQFHRDDMAQQEGRIRQEMEAELKAKLDLFKESITRTSSLIDYRRPAYAKIASLLFELFPSRDGNLVHTQGSSRKPREVAADLTKIRKENALIISIPVDKLIAEITGEIWNSKYSSQSRAKLLQLCDEATRIMKLELLIVDK